MTRTEKLSESSAHDLRADDRLHEDQPKIVRTDAEEFAANRRWAGLRLSDGPGDSGPLQTRAIALDVWQGQGLCQPRGSPAGGSAAMASNPRSCGWHARLPEKGVGRRTA